LDIYTRLCYRWCFCFCLSCVYERFKRKKHSGEHANNEKFDKIDENMLILASGIDKAMQNIVDNYDILQDIYTDGVPCN